MMHLVLKIEKEFDVDESVKILMDMLRNTCFVYQIRLNIQLFLEEGNRTILSCAKTT